MKTTKSKLLRVIVFTVSIFCSVNGFAKTIEVKKNNIIQHVIYLLPGFATMMQFPQDIMSMDLADSRIAYCERSKVDPRAALCKPTTYDLYSTNLIVTTESNKFNLTLSVGNDKAKTTDIINFTYSNAIVKPPQKRISPEISCSPSKPSGSLLDNIISAFKITNFRRSVKNEYAKLKTDKLMFVGEDVYLTFFITNDDYANYEILKADLYLEKLGGMTGWAVQDERVVASEYRLTNNNIRNKEQSFGVIKFKRILLKEDQSFSLRIVEKTDKRKDLYFRFNIGT